ncbi:MAG: exo-alpha-sialidase, partial [Phycisphaerales bacterium]
MSRKTIRVVLAIAVTFVWLAGARSAKAGPPEDERTIHREVPDDPYIPVPLERRATGPAGEFDRNGYVSVQVNVSAEGLNIIGDAANEPSLAVDPTNPLRMAIGWRQFDTIASNFRQAGWGYTTDGGQSWTFPGVIEPTVFRSDPVLDADAQGNFYYNSLTTDFAGRYWCHVYESTDGGAAWDDGIYAFGGDKQWMTIDRTDGFGHDNNYAVWNSYYSDCDGGFTRSYDGGQSFLDCLSVPSDPYWGTLTVGPDGELYIAGNGFIIVKSTTLRFEEAPAAFDFTTAVDLDGTLGHGEGPNPGGLLGQAWVAVDHSDGPTRGNVYLLASVDRFSTSDPLDVMFARSEDGGVTWSDPVRVNDDPEGNGAWQWFGTMSVAPNGRIDAIWADTRNDPGGYDSELYYAYSVDAGISWSINEAISPSFDPHLGWPQQNKLGDYYDMVSDNGGANVAYAATFNGEQDVYFVRLGEPLYEPGPAPGEHIARKNRYVSFAPRAAGTNLAFRVDMTASYEFPESVGEIGWVGEADGDNVSRIVGLPYYSDSWPEVVHIGACQIIPVATYEIRGTADGVYFSAPLE